MFRPASVKVLSPKIGCASDGFGFKTPPPLVVPPEEGLAGGAAQRIAPFGGFRPLPPGRTVPGVMPPGEFGIYGSRGRRLAQMGMGIRFEVKDAALGNFIPNASVSLVFEDGTHVATKLTDAGGNVSFSEEELISAVEQAGLIGTTGVAWYTIEAPGYKMAEGIAWDPDIPAEQQTRKIYEIALQSGAPTAKVDPLTVAGVTTAALLAIALL